MAFPSATTSQLAWIRCPGLTEEKALVTGLRTTLDAVGSNLILGGEDDSG